MVACFAAMSTPSVMDKPLRHNGISPPLSAPGGKPISAWARKTLRKRFRTVLKNFKRAVKRPEEDPEYVHQTRVACRRAVAALDALSYLLPDRRRRRLRRILKRIRRAAGEARDGDVFLQRIAGGGLAGRLSSKEQRRLVRFLKRRRATAQKSLQRIYKRFKPRRLKRKFDKLLNRTRWRGPGDEPPATRELPRLRAEAVRGYLENVSSEINSPEELHRLRIQGKELRYALELFRNGGEAEAVKAVLTELKDGQDRLGKINDCFAAEERLRSWKDCAGKQSLRETLDRLADAERCAAERSSADFCRWWRETGSETFRFRLAQLTPFAGETASVPGEFSLSRAAIER